MALEAMPVGMLPCQRLRSAASMLCWVLRCYTKVSAQGTRANQKALKSKESESSGI